MRHELREILARVFVALIIFLIGVVIYKASNPYAYPDIENRILFVLVPSGIVLLYLYLDEEENRDRLFSVIMVTIGRLPESKFMRFCEGIWERSPSLIRTRVSKVLAELYPYLHKISRYVLKQDPKEVISYVFLGLLLMVALQSVFPQPSLEWAKTSLMIAAVVLGAITFYLNRGKLDEIEDESRQEEIEENRREMEFADKYPRINRVWGVRWIAKGMYKEGWGYSLSILIIGSSILLIKTVAGSWDSPQGQFHQLRVALGIISTGLPIMDSGVIYLRAIPFSYMLAGSIKLFGFNMVGMKFSSVLFSILTSFILYFILKQSFNKDIGFLGFAFFNFSGITFSPYLTHRFYSMGWFFIYLSLLFLIQYNKEYNRRDKYLFFICSLCSIVVTKVGLVTIPLYFLKSSFSLNFKKIISQVADKYFCLYLLLALILFMYLTRYIIPSDIIIEDFTTLSFSSSIPFIRDDLLFEYFLKIIFNIWGIWFVLGFVGTLIYILNCKQKTESSLTYLLALILIGYISISILPSFKAQPRIIYFIIPAITSIIIFPFGILFYNKLKKNMPLIIIFALVLAVIIDPFSIILGLSGEAGDRIPKGSVETHSWSYILAWKDQTDYLNTQYREGDWVFTSNHWIDFYFKGNYSLLVPNILDSRLYQTYQGKQRYLMTNAIAYYRCDEINEKINEIQSTNNSVYFVEFPDFLSNVKRIDNDNTFLQNAELIYDGQGQYDRIWKIDCTQKC